MAEINTNNDLLGETGRGIRLAYSLTDSLSFKQPGNQVEFYKYVGRKERSPLEDLEEAGEHYNHDKAFTPYIISEVLSYEE